VKERFPKTIALLLTGYEDAPEVGQACKDGVVYAVVGKPWVASQLKETIAKAVRIARGG
jgi:hypothetical protein